MMNLKMSLKTRNWKKGKCNCAWQNGCQGWRFKSVGKERGYTLSTHLHGNLSTSWWTQMPRSSKTRINCELIIIGLGNTICRFHKFAEIWLKSINNKCTFF